MKEKISGFFSKKYDGTTKSVLLILLQTIIKGIILCILTFVIALTIMFLPKMLF